jgi:fructose-1,6-bisphosphatase-3
MRSQKLQAHVRFLLRFGAKYQCYNGNLLLHGSVPLSKDGSFMRFEFGSKRLWGRRLYDYCDKKVARAFRPRFPKLKSATAKTLSGGCGAASIRRFSGACA